MSKTKEETSEEICDLSEWTLTITATPIKSEHFNPMSTLKTIDQPLSYDQNFQLGTCNLCGGIVETHAVWSGTVPPPAICSSCGATEKRRVSSDLPILNMEKPKQSQYYYSTDSTTGDKYHTKYSPGSTTGDDK